MSTLPFEATKKKKRFPIIRALQKFPIPNTPLRTCLYSLPALNPFSIYFRSFIDCLEVEHRA